MGDFRSIVKRRRREVAGVFSTCNFNSFSLMALSYGLDLKESRPFDLILKHHKGMTHPVAPRWIGKKNAIGSFSSKRTV